MAEPKTISNHFSVTTVEDGEDAVLYEVECNMENIVIASDTTSKSVTPTFRFYRKVGAGTRTAYAAYWRVFFRAGTTYTSQASSGGTTSATPSLTVTTSIDAVVCFLYSAGSSSTTDYLAKCEIAVVKNGDTGIQGKMSRVPYYAGMWGDVSGQSFVVTDYMTPYVNIGSEESPDCKIFVGDNGTYTFPTTLTTYDNSSDWAAMDTEFKYLITEAVISKFGQFGSSIFNGDYQYSQHGIVGTADSTSWTTFSPSFISGSSYSLFEGKLNTGGHTTYGNKLNVGSVFLVSGISYTVFTAFYNGGSTNLYVGLLRGSVWKQILTSNTKNSDTTVTATFTVSTSGWYNVAVYGGVADIFNVTISSTSQFVPNYAVDLLQGLLACNKGYFRNVTVEGMISNLVQEITDSNAGNFGVYSGTSLFLNPLKCGNVLKVTAASTLQYIHLPIAYYDSGIEIYPTESFSIADVDRLRQMVGKKMYLLIKNQNQMSISAGGSNDIPPLLVVKSTTPNKIPQGISTDAQSLTTLSTSAYRSKYITATGTLGYFFILECKMGTFNDYECIYWEVERYTNLLDEVA